MRKGDRTTAPDIPCAHPDRPRMHRNACSACFSLFHHNLHREKRLARARKRRKERYATEPEYRERLKANSRRHAAKQTPAWSRWKKLRTKYGLTAADYSRLLKQQGGKCAICRQPETRVNQYGPLPLSVDHCHKTGRVRGLLCLLCNTGIGKLQDSPKLLRAALTYLEKETK